MKKVVRIHTNDDGNRVAILCKTGHKHGHVVWIESKGVVANTLPLNVIERATNLDLDVEKSIKQMLKAGRSLSITKRAKHLLKTA